MNVALTENDLKNSIYKLFLSKTQNSQTKINSRNKICNRDLKSSTITIMINLLLNNI
jgi:hypothetical protein